MSEVKPYKLPEEKTSIVSDSMAVRITPDTDIATLRHNVMDAVYATSDQNALYSCLVFLSNQKQTLQSSVKEELLNRLDELSKLPDGWDGEGSLALSRNIVDFVKRIILLAADSSLQDWVAFPDARGYIYLDYTEDNNIAGITKPYNERILKDALLNNITKFLTELGTGFAYVGKEYRLQIGEKENFIDLLFYNLNLSCYIVLEVKIGSFTFADVGQLGGYVVACNHLLRKEGRDNPTIGLLICKEKDRIQAQYALESSSQPIAISEYDLEKFYPEKLEGTMPTIEEWEAKLGGNIEHE